MSNKTLEYVQLIAQTIYDKKGLNPIALDVHSISSITDYIIICEGNVDRHVSAIAKTIVKEMQEKGEKPVYIEGLEHGDWIIIDYGNIMVHIFKPGLREQYQLERLWSEGEIVDLAITTCNSEPFYG